MDQTACAGNLTDPGRAAPQPCPQADRKWVLIAAILASALAFIDGSVVASRSPPSAPGSARTSRRCNG